MRQVRETEGDRTILEQYRPYITMMRARALASQALKDNEPKAAIHAIDQGLEALKSYFSDSGRADAFEESPEVRHLRGMRDALIPKLPVSQKGELKQRLAQALAEENYELAAILRGRTQDARCRREPRVITRPANRAPPRRSVMRRSTCRAIASAVATSATVTSSAPTLVAAKALLR